MKLLRTTALTAALMTAAVMSITSPAQAQARLAWWGWPGLVAGGSEVGNGYATAYGYYPGYGYGYRTGFGYAANSYAPAYNDYSYPAYAYGYGGGYGYPPDHPAIRRHISSHPFMRRHVPLWAGVRRHWQ
jgi:hypothetical protein